MISDEIREKLQNIVRGELHQGQCDSCTTIRDLLCESFGASPTVKSEFGSRTLIKEKQVGFLNTHAQKAGLWLVCLIELPSSSNLSVTDARNIADSLSIAVNGYLHHHALLLWHACRWSGW